MEEGGIDLYDYLKQKDPVSAKALNPSDRVRIERALEVLHLTGEGIAFHQARHALADQNFEILTIILDRSLQEMDKRLRDRTEAMFEAGLVEETQALLNKGYSPDLKPLRAVGYLECVDLLNGRLNLSQAKERVFIRTRQLAKRQRTWFRGQVSDGKWLYPNYGDVINLIADFWGDSGGGDSH
jgi:tRNA dimethylallyltransferase